MGLDVSHDCWSGSYSAFFRFRNEIAKAAGFTLKENFEPGRVDYWQPGFDELLEHDGGDPIMGEWETLPEDPLLVLLIHSDCDGIIPGKAAPFLAERLEQLAPGMPDDDDQVRGASTRAALLRFAAGLRDAAEADEDVKFA